ncbi:MAG: hypothetical protein Q9220_003252 [cf. Caloplaca sp. 1 TL-2023]
MRASIVYVASCLLALAAAQAPSGPNYFTLPAGFMINAGSSTPITWNPTTGGTVTIRLRSGASSDLESGTVVASHLDNNGKATITVPADTVRNSDYTLEIVSDSNASDVNYSAPLVVESKNTVASVSSPASSATMASTADTTSATAMTSATNSMTTNTGSTSMMTTRASTKTTMSTKTGSSSMTQSTGSASGSMTGSAGATATGASTTTAPSSGAVSLKVQGLLWAALIGVAALW